MDLDAALPYLAGAIAIPIVNWAKNQLGWTGKPVVLLSVALSGVLAFVAMTAAGGSFDLATDLPQAFAAATVIYKLL